MFVTHFLKRVLPFALALLAGVSLWWLVGRAAHVFFCHVLYYTSGCAWGEKPLAINSPHGGGVGPSDGVSYSRTFTARDVTRKAVLLSKPEPGYTTAARELNVTGTVKLRMVLVADGRVSNITVIEGLPCGLTERAVAAAQAIQFTPAQKDGRAVSQWVTVEYNFEIY